MSTEIGARDSTDVVLSAGHYRTSISPIGCSPRELTYNSRPLIATFPAGSQPPLNSGAVLGPWPNRVADGVFNFRGQELHLNINEPSRNNAIHGFTSGQRWVVVEHLDNRAVLTLNDGSHQGWPWPLRYTATWNLDASSGLSVTLEVENNGTAAAPLAIGFHPYLNPHGHKLDECVLVADIDTYLPLDSSRNLPCGPLTSVKTLELDHGVEAFRTGVHMDGVFFDHCFGPTKDSIEVQLVHLESGDRVVLRSQAPCRWLQIFSADPAYDCGYPGIGRVLAVEPMTVPPDALRSGIDLKVIEPGEKLECGYSISVA